MLYYYEDKDSWSIEEDLTYTMFFCRAHKRGIALINATVVPESIRCCHKLCIDLKIKSHRTKYKAYTTSGQHVDTISLLKELGYKGIHTYDIGIFMNLPLEEDISKVTSSQHFYDTEKFTNRDQFRIWLVNECRKHLPQSHI
jgi:hypothetical protein